MMGPAFALTSNSSVDLTFDDFDEVREHPHSNSFLLSLEQIIQGAFGSSVADLQKYKPEFKDVDQRKFDQHIQNSEYCQAKLKELDLYEAISSLLREVSPDFHVTMDGHLYGFMGLKYELQGAGYGDLALLIFNCITQPICERLTRHVVSDFNES